MLLTCSSSLSLSDSEPDSDSDDSQPEEETELVVELACQVRVLEQSEMPLEPGLEVAERGRESESEESKARMDMHQSIRALGYVMSHEL